MGVLLIMKLSSKFTFDYKYIINGFQYHNESARAEISVPHAGRARGEIDI